MRAYGFWFTLMLSLACVGYLEIAVHAQNPDATDDPFTEANESTVLRSDLRPSIFSRRKVAGLTAEQEDQIAENCGRFGKPVAIEGANLGPTRFVCRKGYVLEHSSESKIPLWVCEHSTREEVIGNAVRNDKFAADPLLAGHPRAELSDYKHSGFSRGHMAPAGDQAKSQELKDQTFFLSNMIPQVQTSFNGGIWQKLEDSARDWTEDLGESYIVTGPMFYDPLEETPETADGFIPFTTVGDNEVAVPTHCYKIILAKGKNDKLQTIAFVMQNKNGYGKPYRLEPYIVTIDWIEERTGINFFPKLTEQEEEELETKRSPLWSVADE